MKSNEITIIKARLKSMVKETNTLYTALSNYKKEINETSKEIEDIYAREDSVFEEVLEKVKNNRLNLTNSQLIELRINHLQSSIYEMGKLLDMLGEEIGFDTDLDRDNYVRLQNELNFEVFVLDGVVSFKNEELIKNKMDINFEAFTESLRQSFEKDKLELKNNREGK